MSLPNITSYAKNVAKSIIYSTVDTVKTDMPTLAAYVSQESNKEIAKSIYSGVRDYKSTLKKAKKAVSNSKLYEISDSYIKNALEDIKTGKFYNKERIDKLDDNILESQFGSFDDMDIDIDLSDTSSEISSGDRLVAAATQVSSIKAADMISQTQLKSTEAILKSNKISTQLLYNQGAEIVAGLKHVAFTGSQTQGGIVNLTQIQKTAAENSKSFYENTTNSLNQTNAMLKEMLEMNRALYKGKQQSENNIKRNRMTIDDIITADGALDLKAYFGNVKNNTKSFLSEKSSGMLDMLQDTDISYLKSMSASPLSFMSAYILRAFIPSSTSKVAKELDKTLSGMSTTMIARFNRLSKDNDNPFLQAIGQIFGLKTRTKSSLDTSKYNKGAVPFDGIVRKTIVDVIPTYLRRIESALTGQPEQVFDPSRGKWVSIRSIKTEYENMIKSTKRSANSDLVEEISKVMNSKKSSKFASRYDKKDFAEALERMLDKIYEDDGDFKYKSKEDASKYGIYDQDLFEQIAMLITNKKNKGMRQARINHSNEVMYAKNLLNKRMEMLEESGDSVLFQLFNNSTQPSKFITPKYEEKRNSKTFGGPSLINQKDNLGNNIFFYLQNIYKTLSNGMSGGGSSNIAFDSSNFRIKDNSIKTKSEKEKYNEQQLKRNLRYDDEIKKFIASGGSVYDMQNTKANINKDRYVVDYSNAKQMIEEMNSSKGWLADLIYSEDKINKHNQIRQDKNLDPITGNFFNKMKLAKSLSEKLAVLQDQVNAITRKPGEIATSVIQKADAKIYDFFYGEETGEKDSEGNNVKGFMQLMSVRLNNTLDKFNEFVDTKIFAPIKKKLGIENTKDLLDKLGITNVFNVVLDRLVGEKDSNGKRKGGILGDIRDETKSTFIAAKNYVADSFKDVFSPITSRVKRAWENKPTMKKAGVIAEQDVTDDISENIISNFPSYKPTELYNAFLKDNRKGLEEIQKDIYQFMVSNNLPNSDLVYSCMSSKDVKYLASIVNSTLSSRKNATSKYLLKVAKQKFGLYSRCFDYNNRITNQPLRTRNLSNSKSKLDSTFIPGKKLNDDNIKKIILPNTMQNPLQSSINNFIKEIGISPSNKEVGELQSLIYSMMESNYDPKHPGSFLNKISATDFYSLLESNNMNSIAQKLKANIINKYDNQNVSLETVITGKGKKNTKSPYINNFGRIDSTLQKILNRLESIIYDNAVKIIPKSKVPQNYTNPTPSRVFSHDIGGRESETEGDSTGDSDGELHSSAYGNKFSKNTTSALSKDEIYGRNGLYGKVPTTGVYDVKAGTVIYPTKKNKAIEVANEQSAITKFANKFDIRSNAEAKNKITKIHNNRSYTMGKDNRWHSYSINKNGSVSDYILEDGFIDQMTSTAKNGFNSLFSGLGFNGIANSNTVDTLDKAMNIVKKYAPKMTANGLLGAAVGLLSGNPLLGAAVGASTGFVQTSEKAKTTLFGDKITDSDGKESRTGGIVSKEAQDTIKKYFPNMAKYGVTGATLGLLSPFGIVGGAMIGSAIGWGTTDNRIRESLFGSLNDPKSGLINKEFRDRVKKAAPSMTLGAIGSLLLGPFGLLGNMVLGSGLGMLSTTEGFKTAIFGEEHENSDGKKVRNGGLVGAIRVNIVDPLKGFGKDFKIKLEDFVINDMINPLKESIKPITHEFSLLAKNGFKVVPKLLSSAFSSVFGRPLEDILRDRLITPAANVAGKVAGIGGVAAKNIISAPFKGIAAVGRSLESKHIRSGNAYNISAGERLAFREDHKAKGVLSKIPILGNSVFGSLGFNPLGYRDNFKDIDNTLAGITDTDKLKSTLDLLTQLDAGKNYYTKENRKLGRGVIRKISSTFGSGIAKRVGKLLKAGKTDGVVRLIKTAKPIKGITVTEDQRNVLVQEAIEALDTIRENDGKHTLSGKEREDAYSKLAKMGFKGLNDKTLSRVRRMTQTEYGFKKDSPGLAKTQEEKLNEKIIDNAKTNADRIINTLQDVITSIEKLRISQLEPTERRKEEAKLANKAIVKYNKKASRAVLRKDEYKDAPTKEINGKSYVQGEDGRWRHYIKNEEGKIVLKSVVGDARKDDDDEEGHVVENNDYIKPTLRSKLLNNYTKIKNTILRKPSDEEGYVLRKNESKKAPTKEINGKYYVQGKDKRWRHYIKNNDGKIVLDSIVGGVTTPSFMQNSKDALNERISLYKQAKANAKSIISNNNGDGSVEANEESQPTVINKKSKIKYVYDSVANKFREFKLTNNGYKELLGKNKQDADREGKVRNKNNVFDMASSLASNIKEFMIGGVNDKGEKKESFISKLLKKLFGFGMLATGIAGAGHLTTWVKNSLIPNIKPLWTGTIFPFFQKHFGGLIDVISTRFGTAINFIKEIPTKFMDLFHKAKDFIINDFPTVFKDKILPWYIDGFSALGKVLAPLTEYLVAKIPKILLTGIKNIVFPVGQSILKGVLSWFNPKKDIDPDKDLKSDLGIKTNYNSSKLDKVLKANSSIPVAPGTSGYWKETVSIDDIDIVDTTNSGGSFNNTEAGKQMTADYMNAKTNKEKAVIAEKASRNAIVSNNYTDAFGHTKTRYEHAQMLKNNKGNTIGADGFVYNDNAYNNKINFTDSVSTANERVITGTGRVLLGTTNATKFMKPIATAGAAVGKAGNAIDKGTKAVRFIPFARTTGKLAKLAGNTVAGVTKTASKTAGLLDKASKVTSKITKHVPTVGSTIQAGKKAVTKSVQNGGLMGKVLTKFTNFISKCVSMLVESRVFKKYLKDAMTTAGKKVSTKIVDKEATSLSKKVVKKLTESVAKKASSMANTLVSKITTKLLSANVIGVAVATYDFTTGYRDAETILGFLKGQEISMMERIVAGLIKAIGNMTLITLILGPEKIVDIFVLCLGPVFGGKLDGLIEKRKLAEQALEEYDKETGAGYSSPAEYNAQYKSLKKLNKQIEFKGDTVVNKSYNKTKTGTGSRKSIESSKYGKGRVYQWDPKYAGIQFNKSTDNIRQTIGDSGCGPTAAVNAVNYAYGTGSLEDAASLAIKGGYKEKNGGTNPKFFNDYFNKNGLDSQNLNNSKQILDSIKQGNPVVMMGKDKNGGNTPYGPNPHYIVGKGIDKKGNIIVDDPESRYGTARYPSSKVIGNTSIAISASKYGRSPVTMVNTLGNSNTTKSNKVTMVNYTTTPAKPAKKSSNLMKSSTTASKNIIAPSKNQLTDKEKYKIGFACLPFVDKPYKTALSSSNIAGTLNSAFIKIGKELQKGDENKSTRTILNNYLSIRMSQIQDIATEVAKYASMKLSEFKSKNSNLYNKFKSICQSVLDLNIEASYILNKKTVGEMCNKLGINYSGDKPTSNVTTYNSDGTIDYGYDANMSSDDNTETSATAESGTDSIFGKIGSLVKSFFTYTDKETGEKKSLLDIFGLGGGDSEGSDGESSGAPGTLSQAQKKIKDMMGSIIGKNIYSQANRYKVDATLNGASQGSADCSSTVQWALKTTGVDPGGDTGSQITSKNGKWVDGPYSFGTNGKPNKDSLALGDLMFYGSSSSSKPQKVSHVEMYWGDGKRIGHGSGMGPKVSDYIAKANSQQYLGSKRFITVGGVGGSSNTSLAGGSAETNKKAIWKFLKGKGYSDTATAAIMANIAQESQFKQDAMENGGKGKGIGLCQWTYPARKNAFIAAVPDWKTNLGGQLDFMWGEFNSAPYNKKVLPQSLNGAGNLEAATKMFHDSYEGSADRTMAKRNAYAKQIYMQFANQTTGVSYGTGNPLGSMSNYGRASNIIRNGNVSSPFNDPTRLKHKGLDIAALRGQPIMSPITGTVIRSEYNNTNGNMVTIKSDDGYIHTFCHLDTIKSKSGDRVSTGSIIGTVGNSGNSSGDHLHYQVADPQGQFVDPTSLKASKSSNMNKSNYTRPIGGSDGIDYTQLIRLIIQILDNISDNSVQVTKVLTSISEKIGVNVSNLSTDKSQTISQLKDKLKAIDSSYGRGSGDLGSSMMNTNTDYIIKAMQTIATD